jgi:muramidase (phage lysozyme)
MAALLPSQRRLLDAIAAGESSGYDIMYGGGKFASYADHPRQAIPITSGPNVGKTSSAAGRYQFLGSTWDDVAKELGLKDFSPENQDAGAWHLAAKTYAGKTGRDLLADLEAGRTQDVASALSGVWTSIPGGIEPNKATAGFDARLGASAAPSAPLDITPANPPSGGLLGGNQGGGLLASLMGVPAAQPAQDFAFQRREIEDSPMLQPIMMQRRPSRLARTGYGGLGGRFV